jgi:hypothetical protein
MDSYYAAYYGSGLKLNEKEFEDFVERYMEVMQETKRDMVNHALTAIDEEPFSDDYIDELFDQMVESDEIAFTWGADAGSGNARKRLFSPVVASPDNGCDGMYFLRYYANGKPNVFFTDREKEIKNPDYVGAILLRHETSYMFYSDHTLDSVEVFEKRPYYSYQEFRQEFQDKMAAYLPDDFDWDAHIGTFRYAQYA